MALETTASIINNFEANLPTNSQGLITAEVLRTELKRLANNMRQSVEDIVFINPSDATDKTVFTKTEVTNLKLGRSIATNDQVASRHPNDSNTFVKMKPNAPGRVDHVVANKVLLRLDTGSFTVGDTVVPVAIQGSEVEVTGSFSVKTLNQPVEFDAGTGGFAVNNLLDLLANFSSSGVPTTGTDSGVNVGDINLDGQVNVNDLLLGLGGYGNPNTIANDLLIPPNVNHQYVGPAITILSPITLSIATGSFVSITV